MSRSSTEEYVVRRECDEPMARSKGLLPCEKDCEHCMACIETTDTGIRQHCNTHRGDLIRKFIQANDEVEEMIMRMAVRWTKEEEELLLKLHSRGWSRRDIANQLNRTQRSVSIKLLRLGAKKGAEDGQSSDS